MKLEIKEEFSTVSKTNKFFLYINNVVTFVFDTEEAAMVEIEKLKAAYLSKKEERVVYSEVV